MGFLKSSKQLAARSAQAPTDVPKATIPASGKEQALESPTLSAATPLAPLPESSIINDDGLKELTRKLKESQSSTYAESTQASAKTDLRYAKFTIQGFRGTKHAVFIPDHLKLSPPILEQVCLALEKEVPSMLLCGASSPCHPAKLSTAQLRKCSGYQQLMNDAKSSLGMPTASPDDEQGMSCCRHPNGRAASTTTELFVNDVEATNKPLIDLANRVLEKKVASAIGSIADTAFRTNVWTFTWPMVSNFEFFLQQCLESGEMDIYRMAVAHMQDKAYMESATARNLLKYLFENSQPMSYEVVSSSTPVSLSGDLWNSLKNTTHREFMEHGFDFWSFESFADEAIKGHPITQWPWPHAELFFFFYREEQSIHGNQTSDADWDFMTKHSLDRESIPFNSEMLAPVAHVFIGSAEAQKKKLLHAIRIGSPVVILDNTPNVAKQMSLFVNTVQKVWERSPMLACEPFLAEGSWSALGGSPSTKDLLEAMLLSKIMNYVEEEFDNSGMDEAERLTLSDIVGLMDLVKRRPQTFKETVCVVDPLQHTADRIASKLVPVMNSRYTNSSRELNTTAIHRSLVMKGWRMQRKLAHRASQLHDVESAMMVAIALVMVLSTTLAVWMVNISLARAQNLDTSYNVSAPVLSEEVVISFTLADELGLLRISLMVMPIIVGLLTTMQSHFHISQKWANVHMAATITVSEIYQFLGNVGPYCNGSTVNQRRFMKRLQDIVQQLSMAGVHEDDLLASSTDSGEDNFPQDPEALHEHINQYLYGIRPPSWLWRKFQDCVALVGARSPSCAWTALLVDGQEAKDPAVPITSASYTEQRILPLRKYYSDFLHSISTTRIVLNVVLVLCLSIGSALGASGFYLWIPVTLSVATFVTSLLRWLTPSETFMAMNNAISMLNTSDLRRQGREIREQRSEATKSHLITTTERLACAVAVTLSGAVLMPEELDDEILVKPATQLGKMRKSSISSSQSTTPYGHSGATTPQG